MTADDKLDLLIAHTTRLSESLTTLSGRLDVLEGRIGPPPMQLPPDLGREDCPEGVRYNRGDGYYYRDVMTGAGLQSRKVCESCWAVIPRYVDFPQGLVSPEDIKTRYAMVEEKVGLESQPMALCLPCYLDAFQRVYGQACAPMSADTYPDDAVIPVLTGAGLATISEPGKAVRTLEVAVG